MKMLINAPKCKMNSLIKRFKMLVGENIFNKSLQLTSSIVEYVNNEGNILFYGVSFSFLLNKRLIIWEQAVCVWYAQEKDISAHASHFITVLR